MSSETKYLNSEYKDFFEKSLLDSDPEFIKLLMMSWLDNKIISN